MDYLDIGSRTEVKRTANVLVSGWFGGRMVYEQGMRVKGVSPIGQAPDVKMLPSDERIEHAMHSVERHMPSAGPTMH